eukprot:CAMPEP_0179069678 /NCGR_PEP_ID=MMETSP0796-20121207/30630_1 /TAXON_ID=73915 /ORGANISM="Pyrodinium bahamense, Strain pbaha01" /LENGTH=51 /DNA_ID=CAMNT_0020766749 /DNA_START=239 /DNA_END=391 /DNA_ORIENTATION=+
MPRRVGRAWRIVARAISQTPQPEAPLELRRLLSLSTSNGLAALACARGGAP